MLKYWQIIGLLLVFWLPACATATRGSSTMFVVQTTPVGAKATTSLETPQSKQITQKQRLAASSKKTTELKFSYLFCEPTPCGIKMPRKSEFNILITKEGYVPKLVSISNIHRKKIPEETNKNTAIAAGVAGVGTVVTAAVIGTELASAGYILTSTVVGSSIAAGAIVAAPVILVGLVSKTVDASSGANYDLIPNPLVLKLEENTEKTSTMADANLIKEFYKNRTQDSFDPPKKLSKKERKLAKLTAKKLENQTVTTSE